MGRDTKLFVRGVSERVGIRELREVFEKYGRVQNVQTGQAGFAFIEMDDERDCYECIRALDGSMVDGQKIIVEKAREKSYHEDRGGDRRDRGERGGDRERGERGGSEFRCYNCNRPGHLARDCTEPPRNPLYADTRGTRIADGGDSRGREDRYRYSRDRDYDRYGRDYRGEYRDDRERDRERRAYDPRYEREYREREYDRRSPSRYSSSYRDRETRDPYPRRPYSPRGRSPERGGYPPAYRAAPDRRSRSRSPPPERSYRSRSPPRDRARTPPDRPRENGDKDLSKPLSPEGRRTPPDNL